MFLPFAFSAHRDKKRADVPLDTATACPTGRPINLQNSSSKDSTSGPCASRPERIALRAALSSSIPNVGLLCCIKEDNLQVRMFYFPVAF